MNLWNNINPVEIVAFLLNTVFSLTVISSMALLMTRFAFRHNPSLRYFVCLSSLICLLVCPLFVGVFRQSGHGLVTVPLRLKAVSPQLPGVSAPQTPSAVENTNSIEQSFASLLANKEMHAISLALAVWGGVVAWGTARFVQGLKTAAILVHDVQACEGTDIMEATESLSRILGSPTPSVFISKTALMPSAVGLIRPVVILPEQLVSALSPTQLRHVLLHEFAHIAYRHTWGAIGERAVKVLFWFHPIVRLVCNEMATAREEVCDNVASQETGAACYARTLLTIAQGDFTAPNIASALSLFGQESSLEARIAGLLHPRRNRVLRMKKWMNWSVAGLAVSGLSLTTLVRVVAADTKSKTSARKLNVLNNEPDLKRKTGGTALYNRSLSDGLAYIAKSDQPSAVLSNEFDAHKSDEHSERLSSNLDAIKTDGASERLDDKKSSEKKADGKTPTGGHSKSRIPGESVNSEHAAKLKAEAEANGGASKGLNEKTASPLSSLGIERTAKLKAEAEWLGKKNSSDSRVAGVQKKMSITDEHIRKLKAEAASKP